MDTLPAPQVSLVSQVEGHGQAPGVEYVAIAPATPAHPRNDSASLVELPDGTLLIAWIEMHASEQGGHDEAPSSIASMRSRDGGRTWGGHRVEVAPGPGDRNVYNPSLVLLPDGDLLLHVVVYASSSHCHVVESLFARWNRARKPDAPHFLIDRKAAGDFWDAQGRLSRGKVGDADCRLFGIADYVDALLDAVKREPRRFMKWYTD